MPVYADWIAVDWGTSNMRAWAMDSENRIIGRKTSDLGMNKLDQEEFEPALLDAVHHWLNPDRRTDVIACGMVGSRQGWIDATYETVPSAPQRDNPFTRAPSEDKRIDVHILHGLCQLDPADVMRGEETQIAGLMASDPDFTGTACLPGTHSKWVRIDKGKVESFTTFLTGEVFDLLSTQSVLRHSVDTSAWDEQAFREAILWTRDNAAALMARLFSVRAKSLLTDCSDAAARATLSGLLIGAELGNISDNNIAIIGSTGIAGAYKRALGYLGKDAQNHDAEAVTLAGLTAARHRLADMKVV